MVLYEKILGAITARGLLIDGFENQVELKKIPP
jgi:hypothetical protein